MTEYEYNDITKLLVDYRNACKDTVYFRFNGGSLKENNDALDKEDFIHSEIIKSLLCHIKFES